MPPSVEAVGRFPLIWRETSKGGFKLMNDTLTVYSERADLALTSSARPGNAEPRPLWLSRQPQALSAGASVGYACPQQRPTTILLPPCCTKSRRSAANPGSPCSADVAQLVEHFTRNEGVPGSIPGVGFRKPRSGPVSGACPIKALRRRQKTSRRGRLLFGPIKVATGGECPGRNASAPSRCSSLVTSRKRVGRVRSGKCHTPPPTGAVSVHSSDHKRPLTTDSRVAPEQGNRAGVRFRQAVRRSR